MKAFIFNSGTGSRMGNLTRENPKGLVEIGNGESMLSRQIRLLKNEGIHHIIISTGPYEEQIIALSKTFPTIKFDFIKNPKYSETNSIYSLFLAKDFIDDDFIILHGDLVFDSKILGKLVSHTDSDVCLINRYSELSEKDFKGRIINNQLKEIAVPIFESNCYNLQPMYKFSKETMLLWLAEIKHFINKGIDNVYAENALNVILPSLNVTYIDYNNNYIEEIDNPEDLSKVAKEFRLYDYKNQLIIYSNNYINEIDLYFQAKKIKKPMFVCSPHILEDEKFDRFTKQNQNIVFTAFSANPTYEEVLTGLSIFKKNKCDAIVAVGGGSALDVGKAIKLYSPFDESYITQKPLYVDLPLIAVPTTAGTGSESTRYAVLYYENEKQSLVQDSILPDVAILDESLLYSVPKYHQKATLLDAFCQAIEAFWSVNSNNISRQYSKDSIRLILENYKSYLAKDYSKYGPILKASNLAGQAINIAQTTAPHAMSYKITSETGIAHGHAVSIMILPVLKHMLDNTKLIQDKRGGSYVINMFQDLAKIFNCDTTDCLVNAIRDVIDTVELNIPKISYDLIDVFSKSVNQTRLKNSPIKIDKEASLSIYKSAFNIDISL